MRDAGSATVPSCWRTPNWATGRRSSVDNETFTEIGHRPGGTASDSRVEPDSRYADALRWDLDGTELSGTRDAGAYQHR
ncbi:hypothetical protein [Actinocatenispora sera]|uniref:Uncharacterized protein n=1 Tax=Actinocatenispora sera TaxID=390989 RepID=A0A810L4S7_9ACTN|nr:hypothetical protein [Actinocatenispora sera]BCJ30019.1 hypothetical protein Asera_41270 [Actinocatenispora sera]